MEFTTEQKARAVEFMQEAVKKLRSDAHGKSQSQWEGYGFTPVRDLEEAPWFASGVLLLDEIEGVG